MVKVKMKDELIPDCPIRNILSRISDRWSLLVLHALEVNDGLLRFGELRKGIPDISQKMLTTTLRTLEEDGLITRKVYAEIPPRVEYALTKRSRALLPRIQNLVDWAKENMVSILKDREKNQKIKELL